MRRSSTSVRAYLTSYFPGDKSAKSFGDLWLVGEMIDIECDLAYRRGGLEGLNFALWTSDTLEHCLSRIGAEVAFLLHKDPAMYKDMLTAKPPGQSDLMPAWAVAAARDSSKAAFQEARRVAGNRQGHLSSSDDDQEKKGGARRRRKAKAKEKAKAKAAPTGK